VPLRRIVKRRKSKTPKQRRHDAGNNKKIIIEEKSMKNIEEKSMKNLSLILNAVLAIAVIFLFVKVFSNNPKAPSDRAIFTKDSVNPGKLPIAYVNVDSLLLNYQFAKEANESLIKSRRIRV